MVCPSPLHAGLNAPPASAVSSTASPPPAGIVKIWVVPERAELNASVDPSGLQAGAPSGISGTEPVASASGTSKVVASSAGTGTLHSRGAPLRLLTNTIVEPSGLSAGCLSSAELLVTRRDTVAVVSLIYSSKLPS